MKNALKTVRPCWMTMLFCAVLFLYASGAAAAIEITEPNSGNDDITDKSSISLSGTCTEDINDINVNGSEVVNHISGSTSWSYIAELQPGPNMLIVNASGDEIAEDSITITYHPSPAKTEITTEGGEDYTTDNPDVTLDGTCPEYTAGVYINGSSDGVSYTPGETAWSYSGTLQEGANPFTAVSKDSGGTDISEDSITITCQLPNLTPPVSYVISAPEYTSAPMSLTWEASDGEGGSGVASATLWYKKENDGTWTDTGQTSPGESGTFTFTPADGEGSYYFATRSTDNDNNQEDEPTGDGDVRSVYDITPPGPPVVTTNAGEDFSTDTPSVTLEGTTPTTVHIYVNGLNRNVTYQAGTTIWSYTGDLTEGPNLFIISSADAAGNMSETSITVEYRTDLTPPVSYVISAPEYTSAPMSLTWEASDGEGGSGVASATLWYKKENDGTWTDTGQTSPGESGTFTFTPADGEGSYYFATRSTDNDNNQEDEPTGDGDVRSVYDITPPGPPVVTTNAGEDFSTDTPSVTLEGTTPTTVHIYVNGLNRNVTYQAGTTIWSYTGDLTEGPNLFIISSADAAGNMSETSITVEYRTDLTPPVSYVISAPEYTSAPMSLTWEASDGEGGSGVASATLWYKKENDGTWTDTGQTSPGESGTFTFTPADGEGSYYFATRSTDNDNNQEDEPTGDGDVRSVYDITPPGPPVVTTNAGEDFSTDTPSVTLEGTTPTTVHIYVNNSEEGVTYQAGMVNWSYTGGLGKGPNPFTIKSEDAAGNMSDETSITITSEDTEPPTSEVTQAPAYGNSELSISWTASDNLNVASTELWYNKESGGVWTGTSLTLSGTAGTFRFTPADGDGTYFFATRATDNAGNEEAAIAGDGDASTVYDTAPPNSPVINEVYSIAGASVTLTGTCDPGDTAVIHVNGSPDDVAYSAGQASWSYSGKLSLGDNMFIAIAKDAAGNESPQDSITVPYQPQEEDSTPPSSEVTTAPAYGNGPLSIAWAASDDISGVASTELWHKKGDSGEWKNTGASQAGNSGTFTYTPDGGDDTYHFATRSSDNAGNAETDPAGSGDASTIYDTTPPNPPTIDEGYSIADASATLTGTCSEDTVAIYVNGITNGVSHTAGSTSWNYAASLQEGDNAFNVTAADAAGNQSAQATVIITYQPPSEVVGIRLVWDPVNARQDFQYYVLYWGTSSRNYPFNSIDNSDEVTKDGDTAVIVTNLIKDRIYYFAVNAVYEGGESEYSNEAAIPSITFPSQDFVVDETTRPEAYTISGTAAELASVEILANDLSLGTAESSSAQKGASWSKEIDFTGFQDSVVNLTAVSTGATSKAVRGAYTETSDETPPESQVVNAPGNENGPISIDWTASDDRNTDSTALWYKKGADGVWADTGLDAQPGSGGTYAYTPKHGDGDYYFATRAVDTAGNQEAEPTGSGDAVTHYDTTPPALPVITTNLGNTYLTRDPSITLNGTCTDDVAAIYINKSGKSVAYKAGENTWTYTGILQEGDNIFSVTAADTLGNVSDKTSIIVTYQPVPTNEVMGVTLEWDPVTAPDFDHYVLYWGESSRAYSFDSEDNSEDIVVNSETSYTVTNLERGRIYYFGVMAVYAQEESGYSNEAAIPSITSPQDNFIVDGVSEAAYPLSGTAAELAAVEIFANDISLGTITSSSAQEGARWSKKVDFTSVGEGQIALTAISTGATSDGVTGLYNAGELDETPPVSDATASEYVNVASIPVVWTAWDDISGVAVTELWYKKEFDGAWQDTGLFHQKGNGGVYIYQPEEGDGTYYFATRSEDNAGNRESRPAGNGQTSTVYDATVPEPPVINEYSTDNSYVTITGSCPEDTVAVYVNGSADGVIHTPGKTSWSYTGNLEAAENAYDVDTRDAAGNVSSETTIVIPHQDTAPPHSSVVNAPGSGNKELSIEWTASDSQSDVVSTELWYKKGADGTWADTGLEAEAGTGGIYVYTPEHGDGTYYFATLSTDEAGNAESEPTGNGDASTNYDTIPPVSPVIMTNSGDDYSVSSYKVTLGGTCAEDTAVIYMNGSEKGVAYTAGKTSWTYSGVLISGTNPFNVTAKDAVGNESAEDSLHIAYDPPPDGVPPDSKINDLTYRDGVLYMTWDVWDDTSGPYQTELWYKKDADGVWTRADVPSQPGIDGIFVYTPEKDGDYYFATQSTDNVGNAEAQPKGDGDVHTTYDTTPPDTPVITTEAGNVYTGNTITLEGTCAEDAETIYVNGSETGVTYAAGETSWYYGGDLVTGENLFSVTAKDAAGNESAEATIRVTYEPLPDDMTPPSSSITNAPAYRNSTLSLRWEASDDKSGVASTELWYKKGFYDAWKTTGLSQKGGAGTYAYTPERGDGTYYFATRSTDNAGNAEVQLAPEGDASTVYDTMPPASPVISGSYSIVNSSVTLKGTCTSDVGAVYVNGFAKGVSYTAGSVSWTYAGVLQPYIKQTFNVTAQDLAGNMSVADSISIFPELRDETAPISGVTTAPAYGNGTLSVAWNASDDKSGVASTELWYKKGSDGSWANSGLEAQAGNSGTFTYIPAEGDDTYYFATCSADKAGNRESKPAGDGDASTFYDTTPPPPPVIITNGGEDFSNNISFTELTGTLRSDVTEIYVNGSSDGVTLIPNRIRWVYSAVLGDGENLFRVTAQDAAGNMSTEASINIRYGGPANAGITLEWDPVTASDFDHYVLYWGEASRHYTFDSTRNMNDITEISPTSYTVKNLTKDHIYYFAVKAVYSNGEESEFSNEAAIPAIISPSSGFHFEETSAAYTISGTAAELASVGIFANGALVGVATSTAADEGATWSEEIAFTSVSEGLATLTARSTGAMSAAVDGSLGGVFYDRIKPESAAIAPAYGNGELSVVWTASDDDSGVALTELWYKKEFDGAWQDTGLFHQKGNGGVYIYQPEEGDGTYYFATRSIDNAGNEEDYPGGNGDARTIYDTEPPAPPSDTDYTSDESSVVLSGNCPEDTAAVYVNGSAEGVTYIPGQTTWTYTGALHPGENTFEITAADTAGNISSGTTMQVYYESDTSPPTSTATAPEYGNGELSVEWTSSDDDSGVALTRLWYKKDADGVWTDTGIDGQNGDSGTFIYTPEEGDGTYYFSGRSTDVAGNEEPEPEGDGDTFTVYDTIPPDVPVVTTNQGENYSTSNSLLTLEGTCPEDAIAIYVNGSAEGVTYNSGETGWTYTGALQSGETAFEITAADAAGNRSSKASIRVYYELDITPPTSTATAPDYGNGELSVEWTASDNASSVAMTRLWYKKETDGSYADTGLEAQTGDSGVFVYTPEDGDGTYYFAVRSADYAGNMEAKPEGDGDTFTVYDTIPPDAPVVTTNSGEDDSTYNAALTLEGTCSEDAVAVYVNGSAEGVTYNSGETGWTYTGALQPGETAFEITAADAAGNMSSKTSIRISYEPDIAPPSSSATAPDYGNGELSVEWIASDDKSGVALTRLWFKKEADDGLWADTGLEAQAGDSGVFVYMPGEGEGTYHFAVRSADHAGNMEAEPTGDGDTRTIYDTVPPKSLAAPPSYGNGILSIIWEASDPESGVASTELWYKKEADGIWENTGLSPQTGDFGAFSYTPDYGDGIYYFASRSVDTAGNAEPEPTGDGHDHTFYDTTPPDSAASAPAYGSLEFPVEWTASDAVSGVASVKLWYKKGDAGVWTDTEMLPQTGTSGTFMYVPDQDDTYYFATRSADNAGNEEAEPAGYGDVRTIYDTVPLNPPVITTHSGRDYATAEVSASLTGTCEEDAVAIYVNGSVSGVTFDADDASWAYTGTLQAGENFFEITAQDAADNMSEPALIMVTLTFDAPAGGYIADNIIPAEQIIQSEDGDGIITIYFKIKDPAGSLCTLHTFQYSTDGGVSWDSPSDGDSSGALSSGWQDNGAVYYSSAASFDIAQEYAFFFSTRHGDIAGLDETEQDDVRVRFTVNNGNFDSLSPVTSENFLADNLSPGMEISYQRPDPYKEGDGIELTAVFSDANAMAGNPQISIDYADTGTDVTAENMDETADNRTWTYSGIIPPESDGIAIITVTGSDTVGNPVGIHSGNTFVVDNEEPEIESCTIDYANNVIEITFSEGNMQYAADKANYSFTPSLEFAQGEITNPEDGVYRLQMVSVPEDMIFALTVSGIEDSAGNAIATTLMINDDDGDDMPDDWEDEMGVADPDGDPDEDGLSNIEEFDSNTDPSNSDTDGDSLPDGWEAAHGSDPNDNTGINGKDGDVDEDGRTNFEEYTDTLPELTPPQTVKVFPYDGAGMDGDTTRVPSNTSFYILIEDADGINIGDSASVVFAIDDGVNDVYLRDMSDTTVRWISLDGDATELWVVYDRSREDGLLKDYPYNADVSIQTEIRDREQGRAEDVYDFNVESAAEHDNAQDNLPDTGIVTSSDAARPYDTGVQANSGDFEGARIFYDTDEPVKPTFGPENELSNVDAENVTPVGSPVNLQPPTVFDTPVRVFVPCPGDVETEELSVYVLTAGEWIQVCDADGNVLPGNERTMIAGSRVDHNDGDVPLIEIQLRHFSGVQAGYRKGASGGKSSDCFISAAMFASERIQLTPWILGFIFILGVAAYCARRRFS